MNEHWMRHMGEVEGRPGRRGRGLGGPGGRRGGWRRSFEGRRTTADDRQQMAAWFTGRLAGGVLGDAGQVAGGAPQVTVDDDEILVVVPLSPVAVGDGEEPGATATATAEAARVTGFREDTRDQRMRVAEEAQAAFGRVVSWGASCGGTTTLFTTANMPVMTRLRMADRQVLDTLIDAGVARSRSDALAWCVRLVAEHEQQWIADLRAAFERVEEVRSQGPQGGPPAG